MFIEKYLDIDQENAQQMINATEKMIIEKHGDNGFQNTKVYLFDDYAVLKMQNITFRNVINQDIDLKHLERLAVTLLELQSLGVSSVPISAFQSINGNGFIIQPRAKGAELYDKDKISDKNYVMERVKLLSYAPQEHFDKFVADIIKIISAGIIVDFMGKDNFFYDENIGFQFIDLNAHYDYEYGNGEKFTDDDIKQMVVFGSFLPCYFDTAPQYRDTVTKVFSELNENERSLLKEYNTVIFNKCKIALFNNEISEKTINEIILSERFFLQNQQFELVCLDKTS